MRTVYAYDLGDRTFGHSGISWYRIAAPLPQSALKNSCGLRERWMVVYIFLLTNILHFIIFSKRGHVTDAEFRMCTLRCTSNLAIVSRQLLDLEVSFGDK